MLVARTDRGSVSQVAFDPNSGCTSAELAARRSRKPRHLPAGGQRAQPHGANPAAVSAGLPLVVGVSTRALFDLEEEHRVFALNGDAAYAALQRRREARTLKPGSAFGLVKRLLALNPHDGAKRVEIVLLSRNPPDLALRVFRSCERHELAISAGSFSGGRSVAPYLAAWGVDLFLSKDDDDVRAALEAGTAAARLAAAPQESPREDSDLVTFALDGDAVTFSQESEAIFREHGLEAFARNERRKARTPLRRGPFGGELLDKLVELRQQCLRSSGDSRVRIVMVTARAAPAHERVIRTLRRWGSLFDETHFTGGRAKEGILAALGADIFFDDREENVEAASRLVPAGHVPALPLQAKSDSH
jgi:5'-nucleotidase